MSAEESAAYPPLSEEFPDTWDEAQHLNGEGREMLAEIARLRAENAALREVCRLAEVALTPEHPTPFVDRLHAWATAATSAPSGPAGG